MESGGYSLKPLEKEAPARLSSAPTAALVEDRGWKRLRQDDAARLSKAMAGEEQSPMPEAAVFKSQEQGDVGGADLIRFCVQAPASVRRGEGAKEMPVAFWKCSPSASASMA